MNDVKPEKKSKKSKFAIEEWRRAGAVIAASISFPDIDRPSRRFPRNAQSSESVETLTESIE